MAAQEISNIGGWSVALKGDALSLGELRTLSEVDDILRPEDAGDLASAELDGPLSPERASLGASDDLRLPERTSSTPLARALDSFLIAANSTEAETKLATILRGIREQQREIYVRSLDQRDERITRR